MNAEPATHELEHLLEDLERLGDAIGRDSRSVGDRLGEHVDDLRQTISRHLADHPHFPPRGWSFARRARSQLEPVFHMRDPRARLVHAIRTLDALTDEAWTVL